jgi:hypothetical protein
MTDRGGYDYAGTGASPQQDQIARVRPLVRQRRLRAMIAIVASLFMPRQQIAQA